MKKGICLICEKSFDKKSNSHKICSKECRLKRKKDFHYPKYISSQKTKDKIKEYDKEYYKKNKDKILKYQKVYAEKMLKKLRKGTKKIGKKRDTF